MMDRKLLDDALAKVRATWPGAAPKAAVILGSGWSEVVPAFTIHGTLPYEDIPGLGRTGVIGHTGQLVWGEHAGIPTLLFQGRRHYYEGVGWTPIALPIFLMKSLGVRTVLLTNAAGGVRSDLSPGTLMIMTDHINLMADNPLLGRHDPFWGPRFPDQSAVYDPALRAALKRAGQAAGEQLAEGVYLAGSGPAYETPAEIRAWRTLGADAVGMSTVPEALLAKAAGLRVVGLSCITNLAAGISAQELSHEEVTDTTKRSMVRMKAVLLSYWKELARETR